MHEEIIASEQFTNQKLNTLRDSLKSFLTEDGYAVVTGGSYARGEASGESDLDWFVICDSSEVKTYVQNNLTRIQDEIKKIIPKNPSIGGPFGKIELIDEMTKNIGGDDDGNEKITRRLLYLLEGTWLFNETRFSEYKKKILGIYIRESITEHQFCRFLLNDLIRYYRTICVDFEHKTREQGKAWGTRNIKLMFSRKLLYFSGVLVAAETWQHTYEAKFETLERLLALTPIRRVRAICGDRSDQALHAYGVFLEKLGDRSVREMLECVSDERGLHPTEFRQFKNEGHHFSWILAKLLKDTYDGAHPIHNALIV